MITAGAARERTSRSAFVIKASLGRARGNSSLPDPVLHELYADFKDTAYRLNKLGVNLNQAVKRFHATGKNSGEIQGYAEAVFRAVANLDTIAIEIWRRVR